MIAVSEAVREELKKPLGAVIRDISGLGRKPDERIISIGDVCTLEFLSRGIIPHLSVFDFKSMRKPLHEKGRKALMSLGEAKKYANPPGTISESLLADAGMLLEKGGAVLIDGEEDLTALAFILEAGKKDIIVYGQPREGMVIVRADSKLKKKIKGWLASSAALGHEVEGDPRK
ncbi:MAG TPA: DUF359 domain-containing protein [Candidatus Bilamarchaeum sp.]|nr:DUF359 domain-containing protein [Candidatus Bilamarchaeum sp.]